MQIRRSAKFKKAYKDRIQKNPQLRELFWEALEIFEHDPFSPALHTHQLSEELSNRWAFSVDHDCRVIFRFAGENEAVFLNIGTHKQVY